MTLKKWSFLFFTTFFIGGISGLLTGIFIGNDNLNYGFGNFAVGIVGYVLAGLMFSIISQMGFFAYLTINFMVKNIIRSRVMLDIIQSILIVVTFVDLIYLRYQFFGKGGSLIPFILLPLVFLLVSVAVSYLKVRETNKTAWVPSIFFMFVITTLEWIPALKIDNLRSLIFMLIPLFVCNTWQLMQLHRLVGNEKPALSKGK